MVDEQVRLAAQKMIRIGAGPIAKVIVADEIVPEGMERWRGVTLGESPILPEQPKTWFRHEVRTMSKGLRWSNTAWMRELERRYANAKLTGENAMRCPHKGVNLEGVEADGDGTVECPLHGLRWCIRTGRLRPRTQWI